MGVRVERGGVQGGRKEMGGVGLSLKEVGIFGGAGCEIRKGMGG